MAVPPVLSDLVDAPNVPNRSGREDRRSKFYENPDNLSAGGGLGQFFKHLGPDLEAIWKVLGSPAH